MRYVTFYKSILSDTLINFKIHPDKETALKFFNKHYKDYFQVKTNWKAKETPAVYGSSFQKFYVISANGFKRIFGKSIDEIERYYDERID